MRLPVAILLGSSVAGASPDLPVRLALEGCPDVDEAEVRRIAAAELRARPASGSGPDVLEIDVTCDGPRATIRVTDPLSRKAVQRSFNLGLSEPPARSRLVAIAATELVLASWAELEAGRTLTVAPEGGMPAEADKRIVREVIAARRAPPPRLTPPPEPVAPYTPAARPWYALESPADRMFHVTPIASARKFFSLPGLLVGGGIRVGEDRFLFVSWTADGMVEGGSVGNARDAYDVFTATAGGALLFWGRIGLFTARIGAGLRAGVAQVGRSSSIAPWGWPLGVSSISIRIDRTVVLDVSGEAGYVVLPGGHPGQADLRGAWFGVQIGLGIIPVARSHRARRGEETKSPVSRSIPRDVDQRFWLKAQRP